MAVPNIVVGSGTGSASGTGCPSTNTILFLTSTNLMLVALSKVREYTPTDYCCLTLG